MRRIAILINLTLAVLGANIGARAQEPRTIRFQTRTMGTVATVALVTADSAAMADLAYEALLSFHHTDSLMTNWTETSETARINRLAGTEIVSVEPEVTGVLEVAARVGAESDGAFDITVEPLVRLWGFLDGDPAVPEDDAIAVALAPVGWDKLELDPAAATLRFLHPGTRIDLGGVAKGHGVDQVAAILRSAGITDGLIDLSGNMIAMGSAPGKTGWTLGIMDPEKRREFLGTLRLEDQAVATSGNYLQYVMNPGTKKSRKYGHILDPRTGWPADGMASATVIAPDAATADAWATAFIVMDTWQTRRIAKEHEELHVILIEQAAADFQVIWVEESLRERFMSIEGTEETLKIRFF